MKYVETHEHTHTAGESTEKKSTTLELDGLILDSEFLLNWAKKRFDNIEERES